MEAWETNPLDPAYQQRQSLVNRYLSIMNKWEEAYRRGDYLGSMTCFEECVPLLRPFIDMGKAWSGSSSFGGTAIKGLQETTFLYAITNSKAKLIWLREVIGRIPELTMFLPVIDEGMHIRDDTEKILELCSREGGFLQVELKEEIGHSEPGYIVSYLSRFGLIKKVKEGRTNRLFRERFRPNWIYWPLPPRR